MSVVSATAVWVSSSANFCTTFCLLSTPSTSVPRRTSSSASDAPNRPRPSTATRLGRALWSSLALANDRALLGQLVAAFVFAQGERGRQGGGSQSAQEH